MTRILFVLMGVGLTSSAAISAQHASLRCTLPGHVIVFKTSIPGFLDVIHQYDERNPNIQGPQTREDQYQAKEVLTEGRLNRTLSYTDGSGLLGYFVEDEAGVDETKIKFPGFAYSMDLNPQECICSNPEGVSQSSTVLARLQACLK